MNTTVQDVSRRQLIKRDIAPRRHPQEERKADEH
jgi:hypothetical protein